MPVFDSWNRDEWGRLVPGSCVRYGTPPLFVPPPVLVGYITEDSTAFYVTEDGTKVYVPE